MMGFVLGEDRETGAQNPKQWRPDLPSEASEAFPQGLQSRIAFGFADCAVKNPTLWPGERKALKIPGAEPKVTYHPSYLSEGTWFDPNAKLAGLKVYPVHPPNVNPDFWSGHDAILNLESKNPSDKEKPNPSDTVLQFINASNDTPVDFVGTIYCHNLHPQEFGALIWALFLGQTPQINQADSDLRHNIGHLRGFGMGQITPILRDLEISVNPSDAQERHEVDGDDAIKIAKECLCGFLESETGKETNSARERLRLFKSLSYGEILQGQKRLKPFSKGAVADAHDFTRLTEDEFWLAKWDEEYM